MGVPSVIEVRKDSFRDADGDTLTFSTRQVNGQTLPAWINVTETTELVRYSLSPNAASSGVLALRLTATDTDGRAVSSRFSLEVLPSLIVDQLNHVVDFTEDTTKDLPTLTLSTPSSTVTVEMTLSEAEAGVLTTPTSGSATATYNSARGVWSVTGSPRVLPLYNVGYIAAGTPKSLTFSQN